MLLYADCCHAAGCVPALFLRLLTAVMAKAARKAPMISPIPPASARCPAEKTDPAGVGTDVSVW